MFSLQLSDELVFATPTTTQIPEDLMIIDNNPMLENNLISFSSTTSNEKFVTHTKSSGRLRQGQKGQSKYGSYDRRVMHREIERKRREQFSKLYVSLRALLPVDHNKGKRSASDQMEEATNYIKQMHNKIQELRTRRDSLKKLHNSSSSSSSCGTNIQNSEGGNTFQNSVSMHRILDGFEILITKKSPEFELSKVFSQLSERELNVVSCVSTRTKAGFLHKIDIKGSDMMTSLDILELQNKLAEAIK